MHRKELNNEIILQIQLYNHDISISFYHKFLNIIFRQKPRQWIINNKTEPDYTYNESIVQGDPLNSNANLFFRGWMGLVMGINERVSGDGKWNQLWHMEGVDGQKFAYTYRVLEENLSKDFCMNNGKGLN